MALREPITLIIGGRGRALSAYQIFWLKYVRGFDQTKHCMACLRGPSGRDHVRPGMALNTPIPLDRHPYEYLYLCGLPWGFTPHGVHLAMEHAPGEVFEHVGYQGNRFLLANARQIHFPELPERWNGLPHAFTSCKNFQFGVHAYGWKTTTDEQASLPFV